MARTLKTYLEEEKISYKAFAEKLRKDHSMEVTPEAVGYWARGRSKPSDKKTYQAIKDATGGEVTPNEFYEIA